MREDAHFMQHAQLLLEMKIGKIKEEIMALGLALQPGGLTQQYNVCGSPGCRCKADPPQKHGPYYQLSFTRKGKSRFQFVRRQELHLVQEQVRHYQRLKKLTDCWVALGMALPRLRLRQERETRNISERNSRPKTRISQERAS
jgi:hypothetical protein